jgi:hypothetical protein
MYQSRRTSRRLACLTGGTSWFGTKPSATLLTD